MDEHNYACNATANKKVKVSLITLHSSINYGSVLQTYATKHVFDRLNCEIVFVDYTRENNTIQAFADRMQCRSLIKAFKFITFGLLDRKINGIAIKRVEKRAMPMKLFLEKYVNLTERKYSSYKDLLKFPPMADIYCTGSDQVWNSVWNNGVELPYFLGYAPENSRRIAYAASIGREEIDEREKEIIMPYLKKYDYISMREQSGVKILSSMGINADWVIDPTLMLTKEDWLKISKPIAKRKKHFLLVYILNWSKSIERYVKTIASIYELEIYRISKTKPLIPSVHGIRTIILEEVEQFPSYFNEAFGIVTDSFHATAFSLNFHKRFVVIPPPRFSTRVQSILDLTNTSECMEDTIEESFRFFEVDWNRVDDVLNEERKKAYAFLKNAIYSGGK